MSNAVAGGAVRGLVVEPGDRVSAEGRLVRVDDADWLDLAQISTLTVLGRRKSPRSVRLVGLDAAAIPVPDGNGDRTVIPGRLRVVGVWRDDVISVETQNPVTRPAAPVTSPLRVTLPAPCGGWDVTDQSTDIAGLEELRASGTIVRDVWWREHNGALVLRVAASDVGAVERVLAWQLPRRLYVVHSRYSADQLREVQDMFAAHRAEWGIEVSSHQNLDTQCQPYADAMLTRVSADLAAWADTLPDGLLTLHPAMTPA